MMRFIYVFSRQDRDALISKDYVMLKSDETNDIYIFENNEMLDILPESIVHVLSNTLTF